MNAVYGCIRTHVHADLSACHYRLSSCWLASSVWKKTLQLNAGMSSAVIVGPRTNPRSAVCKNRRYVHINSTSWAPMHVTNVPNEKCCFWKNCMDICKHAVTALSHAPQACNCICKYSPGTHYIPRTRSQHEWPSLRSSSKLSLLWEKSIWKHNLHWRLKDKLCYIKMKSTGNGREAG